MCWPLWTFQTKMEMREGGNMSRKVDEKKQVKLAKFAHFVLRAKDLNKSVAWYKTVLGLDVQHQNPMLVFMTYDDEHHRLAIVQAQNKDQVPKGAAGVDHVAYTLDSLEDLLVLYKRLKGEGILPVWPINHGLTTSLYYEDPDGIRVEFQVGNFETKEELNAYIRGKAFAENPIGVNFDPEKLIERFESGDPLEELVQLGSAP